MKNTIVLDFKKVAAQRVRTSDTAPNAVKTLAQDEFKKAAEGLFPELHENTEKENFQLEKDLHRSKIIIDDNGKRIVCSSISEFKYHAKSLTDDQKQYILNVGQQGLFGGGSSMIPASHAIMPQGYAMRDDRNLIPNRDDVPLCVYIRGNQVKFVNNINFSLIKMDNPEVVVDHLMLSMVADISTLKKGEEQNTPIYMIASQEHNNHTIDAIREVQGHCEEQDIGKINRLLGDITIARADKKQDNIMWGNNFTTNPQKITTIAKSSIIKEQELSERQAKLNNLLHAKDVIIAESDNQQTMEAKIYNDVTKWDQNKELNHNQLKLVG